MCSAVADRLQYSPPGTGGVPPAGRGGGRFPAISYRPVRFAATPPILGGELRECPKYCRLFYCKDFFRPVIILPILVIKIKHPC